MIVPKVENRPITSNGLAGFRPATTQQGRITKDRLYPGLSIFANFAKIWKKSSDFLKQINLDKKWLGEIKRRSRLLQEEIQNLETEKQLITVEHDEYVSTKKMAAQSAEILQEEQNKARLNLISTFSLLRVQALNFKAVFPRT